MIVNLNAIAAAAAQAKVDAVRGRESARTDLHDAGVAERIDEASAHFFGHARDVVVAAEVLRACRTLQRLVGGGSGQEVLDRIADEARANTRSAVACGCDTTVWGS